MATGSCGSTTRAAAPPGPRPDSVRGAGRRGRRRGHLVEETVGVGQVVEIAGRRLRRTFAAVQACTPADRHFASPSLPRWYPHHCGAFDTKGRPLFEGRRQVDETLARANGEGDELEYGTD